MAQYPHGHVRHRIHVGNLFKFDIRGYLAAVVTTAPKFDPYGDYAAYGYNGKANYGPAYYAPPEIETESEISVGEIVDMMAMLLAEIPAKYHKEILSKLNNPMVAQHYTNAMQNPSMTTANGGWIQTSYPNYFK